MATASSTSSSCSPRANPGYPQQPDQLHDRKAEKFGSPFANSAIYAECDGAAVGTKTHLLRAYDRGWQQENQRMFEQEFIGQGFYDVDNNQRPENKYMRHMPTPETRVGSTSGGEDIYEVSWYEIYVDDRYATCVFSGSPWSVADEWRGDGDVRVISHTLTEYRNCDGETSVSVHGQSGVLIPAEPRSKEVVQR